MKLDLSNIRSSRAMRFVTRCWRRSPRPVIYAALLFGCCAIAKLGSKQYLDLLNASLHSFLVAGVDRDPLGQTSFLFITIGALTAGASLLLGGLYGGAGLKYLMHPTRSGRRDMKRAFRLTAGCAGASVVFLLGTNVIQVVEQDRIRIMDSDSRAMHEVNQMRRSTLIALRTADKGGHWWSDPGDGPLARDVKTTLREGIPSDRGLIRQLIDTRIERNWEPRVPLE